MLLNAALCQAGLAGLDGAAERLQWPGINNLLKSLFRKGMPMRRGDHSGPDIAWDDPRPSAVACHVRSPR